MAVRNGAKGAGPTRAGVPTDLVPWRIAVQCRGCGRWLTDPRSVALGIGPSCAVREAG
ncbi:DUF6011 domain-containing protein [Mycolicibacter sinensis]